MLKGELGARSQAFQGEILARACRVARVVFLTACPSLTIAKQEVSGGRQRLLHWERSSAVSFLSCRTVLSVWSQRVHRPNVTTCHDDLQEVSDEQALVSSLTVDPFRAPLALAKS